MFSWLLTVHIAFNYLNKREDFLFWMKVTYEIPAKSDNDYRTVGLTRQENKQYWLKEDRINFYWFKLINYSLIFSCFVSESRRESHRRG